MKYMYILHIVMKLFIFGHFLDRQTDRQTDRPTDRQTDRQTGIVVHREVTLPKKSFKHKTKDVGIYVVCTAKINQADNKTKLMDLLPLRT